MIDNTPRHVQRPRRWYLPRRRLTSTQLFAAALIIFAAIMAWGELQIVDQSQANHRLAQRADSQTQLNSQLIRQIQDLQLSGRKTRDDLQRRTDASIAALWCTLVSQAPDDPKKPIIHQVRVKYHCPPFKPGDVGHLPTSAPGTTVKLPGGGGSQTASAPAPRGGQPSVQPRPSGRPAPTSPAPRPTSTPTVPTPTQQPSPPQPVVPVGEVLCRLLGVCLTG